MAYNDLREWIAALEKAGELKRVRAEVDPILEITEITDRVNRKNAARRAGRRCCLRTSRAMPGGRC